MSGFSQLYVIDVVSIVYEINTEIDQYHVLGICANYYSWFTPVSSTNKTDRHDLTEILLKEALNIITITPCRQMQVLTLL